MKNQRQDRWSKNWRIPRYDINVCYLTNGKMNYEKKLADMNREIEKVKIEKERKNDEINSLLKSKTQSQRDIIEKLRTENETMIRK